MINISDKPCHCQNTDTQVGDTSRGGGGGGDTLTTGQVIPFSCGGHDLILMVFESTTIYAVCVYHQ